MQKSLLLTSFGADFKSNCSEIQALTHQRVKQHQKLDFSPEFPFQAAQNLFYLFIHLFVCYFCVRLLSRPQPLAPKARQD